MAAHPQQVRAVMIGTAGHVDHGKTSLVRGLTDFNTDSLKEEQERGLTIDFGVAPCPLDDGSIVGLIDVPGHRQFIRNMVAGASSIDVLMLVIAADDSIMPQTREHMQIASMLGMSRLMVVITKVDLVDEETVELVREEVAEFLDSVGYQSVPVIEVSNTDGRGLAEVRTALSEIVAALPSAAEERAFRMYVRKAFTMKGYGTVVTGVPQSGEASSDSKLQLLPAGVSCRIRSLQNYRSEVEVARAHISTAINLRDVEPEQLERGMALVAEGAFRNVHHAIISLRNASEQPFPRKPLKLRFHTGTAAAVANARTLNKKPIQPGDEGFLALSFHLPQVFCEGDPCVIRTLSPAETIGGGLVVSIRSGATVQSGEAEIERMQSALVALREGDELRALCWSSEQPIVTAEQAGFTLQQSRPANKADFEQLQQEGLVQELSAGLRLVSPRAGELAAFLKRKLKRYHRANSLSLGMKEGYVCELLNVPGNAFSSLWKQLREDSELKLVSGHLALADFKPEISEREMKLREGILKALAEVGEQTIAKGTLQQQFNISEKEWRRIHKLLADQGEVVTLGANLILSSYMDAFEQKVLELFERKEAIELNDFRAVAGTSRNISVAILEHFDSKGLTKRKGNARILNRRKDTTSA